jgi:CubicO group peptidase (beta-lactamase class C family)
MTASHSLPTAPLASLGFDPARSERLLDTLQAEVAKGRLPGAVALIARQGKVVLHEAIGQLDPASGATMTKDAIFRIYSMTKPLV